MEEDYEFRLQSKYGHETEFWLECTSSRSGISLEVTEMGVKVMAGQVLEREEAARFYYREVDEVGTAIQLTRQGKLTRVSFVWEPEGQREARGYVDAEGLSSAFESLLKRRDRFGH